MAGRGYVIVDPCIRQLGGHYATYAAACREGLEGNGHPTRCWAHRGIDQALMDSLRAIPVFTHDCWHRFNRTPKLRVVADPLLAAWDFVRDARAASRTLDDDPILFAPTVDHRQLLAWAWWLRRRDAPKRAVLMLRYSFANPTTGGWQRTAAWVRLALAQLRGLPPGAVTLTTDSTRLADEYRALGAREVAVLPIPHGSVVRHRVRRTGAPPRAVMLGDARSEKGFAVLCAAIERLRHQRRVPELEFILQANILSPVYAGLAPARERLRGLPGVTLLEQTLSPDEYDTLLASADLVLLPYDAGVYRARTSGPFTEALAAAIPVVCTAHTWMSDQLASFGAGETCTSGDADALASAIERAVRHLPELTAAAEQRRDAWVAFHSPASFARIIGELTA